MATGIAWTDETWNCVTGCSHVSAGCEHCYAETLSLRRGWSAKPWTAPNAAENVVVTYLANLGTYPCQIVYIEPGDEKRANDAMAAIYRQDGMSVDKAGRLKPPTKAERGRLVPKVLTAGSGYIRSEPDMPGVGHFFLGDVRKLDGLRMLQILGLERGEVDVVMGGPPCQGFSVAGTRNIMDPRSSLVFEFARLVLEIRPKTFVMENVPAIASMHSPSGLLVIDELCQMFEDGDYGSKDALRTALLTSAGLKPGAAWRDGKARVKVTRQKSPGPEKPKPQRPAPVAQQIGLGL